MTKQSGERASDATPTAQGHVYGYVRVSTAHQADEGESLDVQQRQISGWATMKGLVVDTRYPSSGACQHPSR